MSVSFKIIKNNDESKNLLNQIFSSANSPKSCAIYGNGKHCEKGVEGKLNLWGGNRGDDDTSNGNECKLARVLMIDDEPAVLFNIGVTGTSPTVIDRTIDPNGNVYEFSGIFIVDKYLDQKKLISDSIGSMANVCKADDGFTKAFLTIKKEHPYQKDIFLGFGGKELTCDNYVELLGENSFHPERFKCEDGKFKECTSWGSEKVQHPGWHEYDNCTNFIEKTAFVFDMSEGHMHFDL